MKRWIHSQQIGLLAHWLQEYAITAHESDDASRASALAGWRDRLRYGLELALDEYGWDPASLRTLPPSTLQLLLSVVRGHLGAPFSETLPEMLRDALHAVGDVRASLYSRAQDWVHYLLHAPGDPGRLLRLGESIFGDPVPGRVRPARSRWEELQDCPRDLERFGELVTHLRDHRHRTDERIGSIADLTTLLDLVPHAYAEVAQIENVLLQQAFCWPLLVITGSHGETGFSFPVSVDVDLPDYASLDDPAYLARRRSFSIAGGDRLDFTPRDETGRNWLDHLARASAIARDLWRGSHGHYGEYRTRVRHATADFDFRTADAVVAPILRALRWHTLPVSDGSAVPYFAQVLLERLLGRQWSNASAVTGLAGDARSKTPGGQELLDCDFLSGGAVGPKLWFVFASRRFERVIVPVQGSSAASVRRFFADRERHSSEGRAKGFAQRAEVIPAFRQSNVADAFHVDGWRKWSYVRLPSVARAIHAPGRPGLLNGADPEVGRVLRSLSSEAGPVAVLEDASPAAVASALWHVNHELIPTIIPKRPPHLSWCFVRVIEEEQDTAFWHLLWRFIGAPLEDFERFRHAPTVDLATRELERALNRYAPDDDRPSHRAPDFVVLVGAAKFNESYDAIRHLNPAHRPLAVAPILARLGERDSLRVSPVRGDHSELSDVLGRTRIALLPSDLPEPAGHTVPPITDADLEILRPLSVFRWGFRQQAAGMALRYCGPKSLVLRERLDDYVARDILGCVGGTYYFPPEIQSWLQQGIPEPELARYHFAAGTAIAPYATDAAVGGLAYDLASLPEHVHEARYHLHAAFRRFDELQVQGINVPTERPNGKDAGRLTKANVAKVQQRLSRFATLPSWGAVNDLLMARDAGAAREAYLMADEILRAKARYWPEVPQGERVHPVYLLNKARALRGWRPGEQAEVIAHFQAALDACENYPAERKCNVLHVLPYYANTCFQFGRRGDADRLDGLILALRQHWTFIAGEWFERRGDDESDDRLAADIYADGLLFARKTHQLPFKALGAATRARCSVPAPLSAWLAQGDVPVVRAAAKAMNACRRDGNELGKSQGSAETAQAKMAERVVERWANAVEWFESSRQSDAVRKAMAEMSRHLQGSLDVGMRAT